MKNKPLLMSALVFGGIGLIILILGAVFYMDGNNDFYESVAGFFGMAKSKVSTSTFCQFGIVFELAAFVLGYRSLKDESNN